ncbi:transposase [Candidatus Poribacteria bacterium]
MDDRKAMAAILYIFQTGCKWQNLPHYLGELSMCANNGRFLSMNHIQPCQTKVYHTHMHNAIPFCRTLQG